jgi:hypothetical protein
MITAGMVRRSASRRLPRLASFALALFATFLFTEQVEHHDIACHLKTPQHCMGCAVSALGSDPNAPAAAGGNRLADAGAAVLETLLPSGTMLPARSSGRSPPPVG